MELQEQQLEQKFLEQYKVIRMLPVYHCHCRISSYLIGQYMQQLGRLLLTGRNHLVLLLHLLLIFE